MMTRFLTYIWQCLHGERGAVTPTLIMMSSVLAISGGAFMTLAVEHQRQMIQSVTESKAKTQAEREVRRTLWQIGHTDPRSWNSLGGSPGDSTTTATFDSASGLLTVTATIGTHTDTIRVFIDYDPVPATQLENMIAYASNLVFRGSIGETSYQPGYGPRKVDRRAEINFQTYWDNADYQYRYNQVFEGEMEDGVHVVNGSVNIMPGTSLEGSIIAMGSVVMYGDVSIEAEKITGRSEKRRWDIEGDETTYFPAVAACYGSIIAYPTIDEDRIWEYYEMYFRGVDQRTLYKTLFNYADIRGMTYSYWDQYLLSADVDGVIVGGNDVQLWDAYTVSYNAQYINPPPGLVLWPDRYEPIITEWIEGQATEAPPSSGPLYMEYQDTDRQQISSQPGWQGLE